MSITDPALQYKLRKGIYRYLGLSVLRPFILSRLPFLADRLYELSITERIIEYPFVHSNIEMDRGEILDVGSGSSKLPLELASRGYKVWALDLRMYPYSHPNLTPVQEDIRKTNFPDEFFDCIIGVSSIEHIGMKGEGDSQGDKKALVESARILRVGGTLLMTVPFGKRDISYYRPGLPRYRVYDLALLQDRLSNLKIEKVEYAINKGGSWVPSSLAEAEKVDTTGGEFENGKCQSNRYGCCTQG